MPSPPSSELTRNLRELMVALASGQRRFPALRLPDLNGVDLDLCGCVLSGSCCRDARFGHARLRGATVNGASFQQALLWGADLQGANLGCDLRDVNLSGAQLPDPFPPRR